MWDAIGVLGEEDSRLLCPESVSRPGGLPDIDLFLFGATDVAFESIPDCECVPSLAYSSSSASIISTLGFDVRLAVLALDSLDFVETLDLSSRTIFGRPNQDLSLALETRDPPEIGRASCRERVF